MRNKLKTTKQLTKEEVYEIILDYLKECQELSIREMRRDESFSRPAWSEYQACQLGMQKAYQKIMDFIPLTKESNIE